MPTREHFTFPKKGATRHLFCRVQEDSSRDPDLIGSDRDGDIHAETVAREAPHLHRTGGARPQQQLRHDEMSGGRSAGGELIGLHQPPTARFACDNPALISTFGHGPRSFWISVVGTAIPLILPRAERQQRVEGAARFLSMAGRGDPRPGTTGGGRSGRIFQQTTLGNCAAT